MFPSQCTPTMTDRNINNTQSHRQSWNLWPNCLSETICRSQGQAKKTYSLYGAKSNVCCGASRMNGSANSLNRLFRKSPSICANGVDNPKGLNSWRAFYIKCLPYASQSSVWNVTDWTFIEINLQHGPQSRFLASSLKKKKNPGFSSPNPISDCTRAALLRVHTFLTRFKLQNLLKKKKTGLKLKH